MSSIPPWRQKTSRAFTAVTPKRTLSRPSPSSVSTDESPDQSSNSTTTTETTSNNKGGSNSQESSNWPESLKRFISRSFDEAQPEDREVFDSQLREIITKAHELGTTWTTAWDNITLPIIQQRRQERLKKAVKENGSKTIKDTHEHTSSKNKKRNLFKLNESESMRAKRLKRFETSNVNNKHNSSSYNSYSGVEMPSENVNPNEPIVGRSTQLEKRYLRLTSAADPNTVRPLHILKQTLELLKKKWQQEENYSYICDQFKSLRQDLTVQHIQNEFTVTVYEIHARIALENRDLGEYNQCQSQLKTLYEKGIPGNEDEFLAYRILYILYTRNRSDMNDIYFQLETIRNRATGALPKVVQHALDVNQALSSRNYHKLFKLYTEAPNMGPYIMDMFVERERFSALAVMTKAFRPEVALDYVINELGFENGEDFANFVRQAGLSKSIVIREAEPKGDAGSKTTDGDATPGNKKVVLNSKEAYPIVEQLRAEAFKKVDIKGQI